MKLESVKEDKIVEYPKQEKIKISVLKKLKLDSWKKISGIAFVLNFLYQHISNATVELPSIEYNDVADGGGPLTIKIKIFDYIEFGLCLNILISLVILVVKAIKIKKDDKEDLKKKLLPFIIYMIFSIIILIIFEFISIGYL